MQTTTSKSRLNSVIAAAAVIIILAGLLGARILARTSPAKYTELTSPAANVPQPLAFPEGGLEVPCWGCQEAKEWPIEFQTDLDLLAPLGDGPGNAADWFKDFTKGDGPIGGPGWMQDTGPGSRPGPRYPEAVAAMKSRIDGPEWLGKILPPDHPLLLEAEPWCDQAIMKFYPDIFPLDGYLTRIPNLLFPLNLARSWVARGFQSEDPQQGLADMRRAIRLGRQLRQDGVTIIADLVGLACIRIGTEGIYRHAVSQGDFELALTAAIVLGEHSAQRLMTMERVTRGGVADYVFPGKDGTPILALTDERLEHGVISMATSETERRFLGEVVLSLGIVRILGTPEQQSRAIEVLEELATSDDWVTASGARWALDFEPDEAFMKEIVHPPS
jgi:hypothetical protein